MKNVVENARDLARTMHEGQVRKYTGLPYFTHVENVAKLVENHIGDETMIAIAYLHDVVEDTKATYTLVEKLCGRVVAEGVWWLTDVQLELGNRATRKHLDRLRLSAAPGYVQTVKICDMIDNSSSITQHDPDFAERYIGEKFQMLQVLTEASPTLRAFALELIAKEPFVYKDEWVEKYGAVVSAM